MILFTLESDTKKHKQAAQLFYCLLSGSTSLLCLMKPITEQSRWANDDARLSSYKTVGQFDQTALYAKFRGTTRESLGLARELIQTFALSMKPVVLEAVDKAAPDALSLVLRWLRMASSVVPGFVRHLRKQGEVRFPTIEPRMRKLCEGDTSGLADFFFSLRPKMMSAVNEVVGKLGPLLAKQTSQKLAKRALSSVLNSTYLFYDFKDLSKTSQLVHTEKNKNVFKNPTFKDYIRKYSFYYDNVAMVRQKLLKSFEKENEQPFPELQTSIKLFVDLIVHIPDLVSSPAIKNFV